MIDRVCADSRIIQRRIERFYGIDAAPDVGAFVKVAAEGTRERVVVRQSARALEMTVFVPAPSSPEDAHARDRYLQLVEGVSHFVYLAERARVELPATELELELQAEVDKFVLLALDGEPLPASETRSLHDQLYERVLFLHPAGSELGDRYRLANRLAARYLARLMDRSGRAAIRQALQQFYRSGQTDKIRLARAA